MKHALAVLLLATACAGPVHGNRDYELKASETAGAVASSVGTAVLGIKAAQDDHVTQAYLSVLVGGAEKDAMSAQSTFDSRQPPRARDPLRTELDDLLTAAVDGLTELRIEVRRGGPIAPMLKPLQELAEQLSDFADTHA